MAATTQFCVLISKHNTKIKSKFVLAPPTKIASVIYEIVSFSQKPNSLHSRFECSVPIMQPFNIVDKRFLSSPYQSGVYFSYLFSYVHESPANKPQAKDKGQIPRFFYSIA